MGRLESIAMADVRTQMEAFAFRKLVEHLQMRTDVQNIDLMNLSGFCRNCLSKWLHAGAKQYGANDVSYDEAVHAVYGMPVKEWKSKHQTPATPEQLALYEASKPQHAANHDANAPGTQLPLRLHSDVCCTEPSPTSAGAIGAPYCGPAVPIRLGVLTVSDRAANQVYEDLSGPAIIEEMEAYAKESGAFELQISQQRILPDEQGAIEQTLLEWSTECNLILTTGGTGFSERDVTPEATKSVSQKLASGLMSLIQLESSRLEPLAAASRAVIGVCNGCCILNLPGRPLAVRQNLRIAMPMLGHVVSGAGK